MLIYFRISFTAPEAEAEAMQINLNPAKFWIKD